MPIRITGLEGVLKSIGKAKAKIETTMAVAQQKGGEVILRKSNHYVPKDTKDLESTGKVETTGKGMATTTIVSYGGSAPGGNVDYAVVVHENLDKYHAEPTCAKYLERATRETRGTVASIIRRETTVGVRFK